MTVFSFPEKFFRACAVKFAKSLSDQWTQGSDVARAWVLVPLGRVYSIDPRAAPQTADLRLETQSTRTWMSWICSETDVTGESEEESLQLWKK